MRYYDSHAAREAAVASGEATWNDSTVRDGDKHYGVVRYTGGKRGEVIDNLTGTDRDNLEYANALAQRRDQDWNNAQHTAERL
jgi:hypothetical protein